MRRAVVVLAGLMISLAGVARGQEAGVPRLVSGRVFDDSSGCPLKSAKVSVVPGTQHVLTDAHGRYRLANPPSGPVSLRVALAGYLVGAADGVMVTDSTARVDFSLLRAHGDTAMKGGYPNAACRLEPRDSL